MVYRHNLACGILRCHLVVSLYPATRDAALYDGVDMATKFCGIGVFPASEEIMRNQLQLSTLNYE